MAKEFVLGIDAGGSKTLALAAALDGEILGRAQSGPANFHAAGLEAAQAAMSDAARRAIEAAGTASGPSTPLDAAGTASSPSTPLDAAGTASGPETPLDAAGEAGTVRAICIGAAGADRPDDRAVWESWARREFPGAAFTITNDAMIVLSAGTAEGWGLVVISGTGSIAYGRDRAGRLARAGGWGYLMGDEGSNYAIGQAALRAVTRAADGRGAPTALVDAVLAHWKLAEPAGLVNKVYGSLPRKEIVLLGRVVESAAAGGDGVAKAILEDAGRELALAANAVARKLGFEGAIPCALAGSVLVFGEWVRPAFLKAAAGMGLNLDPVALVPEPAQGAVKLALGIIGDRQRLKHKGHEGADTMGTKEEKE